jgi:hypothetical protein
MNICDKPMGFCQKLENIIKEICANELDFSRDSVGKSTFISIVITRAALNRDLSDPECAKVLEQIISGLE